MITVCIPIYNQDVTNLVDIIIDQCEAEDAVFQILCFDDGSTEEFKQKNASLSLKLNVNYTELLENVGRAKIRNKMAKLARYDYMLFLDGDSGIERSDFMKKYLDLVYKQSIVYGGRYYQKAKPSSDFYLHWKYGKKVESKDWKKRAKSPYESFLTNNFMVTAKVMHDFPFDETLSSYGYEDLEWAERIEKAKMPIFHLDNPTIHLGLETNTVFVGKTEKSILNLVDLYKSKKITKSRLIRAYERINKMGLLPLIGRLLRQGQTKRMKKLTSGKGSLFDLQWFKLCHFVEAMKVEN